MSCLPFVHLVCTKKSPLCKKKVLLDIFWKKSIHQDKNKSKWGKVPSSQWDLLHFPRNFICDNDNNKSLSFLFLLDIMPAFSFYLSDGVETSMLSADRPWKRTTMLRGASFTAAASLGWQDYTMADNFFLVVTSPRAIFRTGQFTHAQQLLLSPVFCPHPSVSKHSSISSSCICLFF